MDKPLRTVFDVNHKTKAGRPRTSIRYSSVYKALFIRLLVSLLPTNAVVDVANNEVGKYIISIQPHMTTSIHVLFKGENAPTLHTNPILLVYFPLKQNLSGCLVLAIQSNSQRLFLFWSK